VRINMEEKRSSPSTFLVHPVDSVAPISYSSARKLFSMDSVDSKIAEEPEPCVLAQAKLPGLLLRKSKSARLQSRPYPVSPRESSGSQPRLPRVSTSDVCGVNCISCKTVADLVNGELPNHHALVIIDCRFDYEYEGGHIRGAENIVDLKTLEERLFSRIQEHLIIVLHCEFSQSRGPKAYRFVRELDRRIHGLKYFPRLHYPELYVMKGGYKTFFSEFPHLCEPQSYVSMSDPKYRQRQHECLRTVRHGGKVRFGLSEADDWDALLPRFDEDSSPVDR